MKALSGLLLISLGLLLSARAEAVVRASSGWIAGVHTTLPQGGYYDIEVDGSGNLYVAGCSGNILKIDSSKQVTPWSSAKACDFTWSGAEMAYSVGGNVIRAIAPDGTFSVLSQDSAGWNRIVGLADGSVYASVWCCEMEGLYRIDVTNGQAIPVVVGGPGAGGSGTFQGMAQGSDGKLYTLGSDTSGGSLYRLDGSQLNLVATMTRAGSSLCQGPAGLFLTNVNWTGALGSPVSDLYAIDPVLGTSSIIAHCDIDGAHLYPTISGVTFDPKTQTAYVLESNNKIWAITKIPPITASFGPGEATADTLSATVSWPIEINTPVYVQLERRTEETSFSARFPVRASQSGNVTFIDRFVVPGTRYAFRAYVNADSGLVYSPEVWVDVPPLTPPPPPVEIWSKGSVSVDTASITLDWPINPMITGDVRVERRTPPAAYGSVAAIQLNGDGHVHFIDESVARGITYVYRAGSHADTGWVWSNELSARVPTGPPPPALVWGDGAVGVGESSVTVEWPINPVLSGSVRLERKTPASSFGLIATLQLVGDGKVHFVDIAVIAGESYTYRAGFQSDSGWDWSDELTAGIPAEPGAPTAYLLAFYAGKSFLVHGALDVAFTLPAAGPARVDGYDVSGRKIASASVSASQAGSYSVHLADAGSLRPGMYFLRLIQGASHTQCRAIVVGH